MQNQEEEEERNIRNGNKLRNANLSFGFKKTIKKRIKKNFTLVIRLNFFFFYKVKIFFFFFVFFNENILQNLRKMIRHDYEITEENDYCFLGHTVTMAPALMVKGLQIKFNDYFLINKSLEYITKILRPHYADDVCIRMM